MNTAAPSIERFRDFVNAASRQLPGRNLDWLSAQRALGMKHLVEQPLPTRKDEAWRYSGLDTVLEPDWALPAGPVTALTELDIDDSLIAEHAAARLVFANGSWLPELSDLGTLSTAVTIGSLRSVLEQSPETLARWFDDEQAATASVFTALNTALINDGAFIRISAGVKLDLPIEILHLAVGQDEAPATHLRNLIVLDEDAEASVLEHYTSLGNDTGYFTNSVTEVRMAPRARLEHVRLQAESAQARHLSTVFLHQAHASRYRGLGISLGGAWSRTEYRNRLAQEDADCELNGLYLAGDGQLNDFHLDITHAVPRCSSRERFKGILFGRGRAVFDGHIRVDQDAQKTDAHLTNDNLLLSREAEVDTKPQLEIFADDVKCSHGTTVGQLEPAQLFYLRSRGIGLQAARRLLCLGFAHEVLDGCAIDGVRTRVARFLQQRLDEHPPQAAIQP